MLDLAGFGLGLDGRLPGIEGSGIKTLLEWMRKPLACCSEIENMGYLLMRVTEFNGSNSVNQLHRHSISCSIPT